MRKCIMVGNGLVDTTMWFTAIHIHPLKDFSWVLNGEYGVGRNGYVCCSTRTQKCGLFGCLSQQSWSQKAD